MSERHSERRHDLAWPLERRYRRRTVLWAALGMAGATTLAACGGTSATPTGGTTATSGIAPTASGTATGAARATTTGVPIATGTARTGTATANAPTARSTPDATGKISSPLPGVPDAYLKPQPPFKTVAAPPGRGGTVTVFQRILGTPPPPREQNRFWQELDLRLGVRWEPTYVPAPNYPERLAVTTASGELSDLIMVFPDAAPEQYRVIQQGAYTDLTPYLTGDALKEFPNLARYPERVWRNARLGGKLYGVPRLLENGPPILLLRQDWANKVGIPQAQNAEDFLRLMTAFTKNDPDGNGQSDTWGLSATPDSAFALSFFQQVFRVPNEWRRNPDGSLTNAIETEEFRQTVGYMRRLFEAGVYHPDATTMSTTVMRDLHAVGKLGAYPGVFTGLPQPNSGQRDRLRKANPPGEAVGLVPFGHDGSRGVTHSTPGFAGYVMIPARVGRDRERVKELLRLVDYFAAPPFSEEWNFLNFGIEGMHHELRADGTRIRNEQAQVDGIGTFNNFNFGHVAFYYPHKPDEATYIQGLFAELVAIGIDNPTWGAFSPTQATKARELEQLRIDRIGSIVQGRQSLSALDDYVKDWRGRGGDQIRKEYEQDLKN